MRKCAHWDDLKISWKKYEVQYAHVNLVAKSKLVLFFSCEKYLFMWINSHWYLPVMWAAGRLCRLLLAKTSRTARILEWERPEIEDVHRNPATRNRSSSPRRRSPHHRCQCYWRSELRLQTFYSKMTKLVWVSISRRVVCSRLFFYIYFSRSWIDWFFPL